MGPRHANRQGGAFAGPRRQTCWQASRTGCTIGNDDLPPPKAGHFSGPISSGGAVSFDVNADGTSISNFVIVFSASCQPPATLTTGIRISGSIPIQADSKFTFVGSGNGLSANVSGTFDSAGTTVNGALQIHVSAEDEGTTYECDTGNSSWAATWRS